MEVTWWWWWSTSMIIAADSFVELALLVEAFGVVCGRLFIIAIFSMIIWGVCVCVCWWQGS